MAFQNGYAQDQRFNFPTPETSESTPVGKVIILNVEKTFKYDEDLMRRGSFLRWKWSMLSGRDNQMLQLAMREHDLNAEQARDLEQIIRDWIEYGSGLTADRQDAMCDFWLSTDQSDRDAELSLLKWESDEPSMDDVRAQLYRVHEKILSEIGSDVSDSLEVAYQRSTSGTFSLMSWSDGVRARNDLVNELNFVCGA